MLQFSHISMKTLCLSGVMIGNESRVNKNGVLALIVGTAEALSCIRATQEFWYRADLSYKTILL